MRGKMKKELGLLDIFCIASGAMISSGLFVLPALAFARAGPAAVLAYLLAAVLVIPALLSKAELATAMPRAGGTYFFMERTLGAGVGTFGGLANWLSLALKSAFALVGIGIFAQLVFPGVSELQIRIVAVGSCVLFALLNLFSVKTTGRFQVYLVFFLFGCLGAYILAGLPRVDLHNYVPLVPFGFTSVFATAGLVFVSFGGLTKVASIAEEIRDPNRNIPLGMILAFLVTTLFYVLVVFVTVGVVEEGDLIISHTPISLGASVSLGRVGMVLLAVAAIVAFVSTANAGILTASRFPLAMSRDRLLPAPVGKISFRFGTPYVSILITAAFMISAILFLSLENLVKTASTLMILIFMFVNLAVIIMRESKLQNYRPTFRAPLYPWLQIAGLIAPGFIIFEMGWTVLLLTAGFTAASILWYLLYGRARTARSSAITRVVERVMARELAGSTLQAELREIVRERDNIVEDRFDHLIKKCEIIDFHGSPPLEDAFKLVAETISRRLEVDAERVFGEFMEREMESSTIVGPGLAIPHIVVEGEGKFDLVVLRCREGITFLETEETVHTVFALAGSVDERNFHLRALAAIAQIAQDRDFDRNWLKADALEDLRDIILLAERKRIGVL